MRDERHGPRRANGVRREGRAHHGDPPSTMPDPPSTPTRRTARPGRGPGRRRADQRAGRRDAGGRVRRYGGYDADDQRRRDPGGLAGRGRRRAGPRARRPRHRASPRSGPPSRASVAACGTSPRSPPRPPSSCSPPAGCPSGRLLRRARRRALAGLQGAVLRAGGVGRGRGQRTGPHRQGQAGPRRRPPGRRRAASWRRPGPTSARSARRRARSSWPTCRTSCWPRPTRRRRACPADLARR